jgi:hypothetical protein
MEEINKLNALYSYAFYAAAVAVLLVSAIAGSAYAAFSAILLLLAAVYLNSGHMLNNLLIKRSKFIMIKNGYRLGRNLSSAVKKEGEAYTGVSIAELMVGKAVDNGMFGNIIDNIKDPFEFSVSIRETEKRRLVESLETKKRVKEIALSRIDPKMYNKINQVKKEIEIIEKEMANILGGSKSLEVSIRLKAIKSSSDRVEAELEPTKSIIRIANAFCTNLGLEYRILSGEELLASLS